jgi:SAM-dependent methyltransferase
VLELGCGNGKTAAALVRDASVVAIDFSRKGLEAFRAAVRSPRLELVLGMSATCRSRPLVRSCGGLARPRAPAGGREVAAMKEIVRVLVPGGTLIFREFSVQDMRFGRAGRSRGTPSSGERELGPTFSRGTK